MKDINIASDAELQAELERRKKPKLPVPVPLPNPDFAAMIKMMEDVKAESIAKGYEDKDFSSYIHEMAIEAVYGQNYWKWRNAQGWE